MGGARPVRSLDRGVLGQVLSGPAHEYPGAPSSLSFIKKLAGPSQCCSSSLLRQLYDCPSLAEAGVVQIGPGYKGSKPDLLSLSREESYVVSAQNPRKAQCFMDALSRNTALPGEWELHPQDRENLLHLFPNMEVDLMATPYNAVLKTFVSPFYHPQSFHVDAWSLDWNQWEDVYLFPPPSQVHKVFTALRSFQGKMTLILRAHPLLMPPRDLPKPLSVVGPLLHPPRQLVRGEWIPDGRHSSSPWTVHRY